VFFYPGSSIGNFEPPQAEALLATIRAQCGSRGCLLIGVDLVKDPRRLEAAYDDALGVTAAFNRNVLRAVNRALASDFEPRRFCHQATYDPLHQRVEMRLVAEEAHVVHFNRPRPAERHFAAGEAILTEYSYKYEPSQFRGMLDRAGFGGIESWADSGAGYALFLARPRAAPS